MALANWSRMTSTTTGTGALTVAAVTGYPTLSDTVGLNRRFPYVVLVDSTGAPVEAGIGYMSSSTVLVRELVTSTYSAATYDDTSPAAVSLAANTYRIISGGTAEAMQGTALNVNRNASIASQKLIPSQHMTVHSATSTGYTCVANRMVYMPFLLSVSAEVDALGIRVGTGVASTNARLGLYDIAANGHPDKLLGETASLATATTGVDVVGTLGAPIRLQPGWYYLAIVTNGAPAIGRIDSGGSLSGFLGGSAGNSLSTLAYFYATFTFGALPANAATTSLTGITAGTAGPGIMMRMV